MLHGETLHSALPWDLPWWKPDHAIFFAVLYLVLIIIGSGVGYVLFKSVMETFGSKSDASGH